MTSALLAPVAQLNAYLGTTFLPYFTLPLLPCLHAARVTLAYNGIRKGFQARALKEAGGTYEVGPLEKIVGFLIMAWGGSLISAYLSCSIPMQFLNPWIAFDFLAVYMVLSHLQKVIPSPLILDTVLPLIDGATRTGAIAGAVALGRNHQNPIVQQSILFQIILGTIGACGGGQLAFALNIFQPSTSTQGWKLGAPPFLKAKTWMERIDVLAAFAGAVTYVFLSTPIDKIFATKSPLYSHARVLQGANGKAWVDAEAKAAATLVIASIFAYKAIVTHWLPAKTVGGQPKINKAIAAGKSQEKKAQ